MPDLYLLWHVSLQSSSSSLLTGWVYPALSFLPFPFCFSLKNCPLLLGHSETPKTKNKQTKNHFKAVNLNQEQFPTTTPGDIWEGLARFFGDHSWRGLVLLASWLGCCYSFYSAQVCLQQGIINIKVSLLARLKTLPQGISSSCHKQVFTFAEQAPWVENNV